MARKPIQIEMAGMRTPRERMWAAIRKLRQFTPMQVQEQAGKPWVSIDSIQEYFAALTKNSYIKLRGRTGKPGGSDITSEQRHELVRDTIDAPRFNKAGEPVTQGLPLLAMWRAMKVLKQFDAHDVQRVANVGDVCAVSLETAKRYLRLLDKAGYMRVVAEATSGRGGQLARYHLVRDTGAHPPAITRRKAVFDRNLGKFTWQQSEQEVCDGLN